jgi:hypothetical protein
MRLIWPPSPSSPSSLPSSTLPSGTVVKGGPGEPRVAELLPAWPELPVRPADVRALAFDEARGRLCLGLYSGEVVVMDFGP